MIKDVKPLSERLLAGDFAISVQLDPPTTTDLDGFRNTTQQLALASFNLFDINSSRRISHDSIQLAMALRQMGLETLPHVTTRDSSINGLINQILTAYSWNGVRNFLIITGDEYEASQAIIPSRGVFQTDSIGALNAINYHLRKKPRLRLQLLLGAAVNQNADPEEEGLRIQKKEEAGADFFMSQPVFNKTQAEGLFEFYGKYTTKPLIVGVWPIADEKTLNKLYAGEIVGVKLPRDVYAQVQSLEHINYPPTVANWGIKRAEELIKFIRQSGKASGVYIVAPSRNPLFLCYLSYECRH